MEERYSWWYGAAVATEDPGGTQGSMHGTDKEKVREEAIDDVRHWRVLQTPFSFGAARGLAPDKVTAIYTLRSGSGLFTRAVRRKIGPIEMA